MSSTLLMSQLRYVILIIVSSLLASCTFVKSKITDFSSVLLAEESIVSVPSAFDDGTDSWSKTETPLFSWSQATVNLPTESIVDYEIKIGTTLGGSEVKEFTSVGNVLQASFSSLSLTKGTQYFASIRAKTSAGKYSSTVKGDGWYVNADMMVPNSTVSAMAKSGTTLFLGGSFTSFGYLTGSLAQISTVSGQPDWMTRKPTFNGTIYSTVSDGNGGYYVGGQFTLVNGVSRTNLAHILSDGSLNPNFTFTTDGIVYTLAKVGDILVVGGMFSNMNSTARRRMGSIDLSTNTITSFDPNVDASIYGSDHIRVMLYDPANNTLYVGGRFVSISGNGRNLIAAYDTTNFTIRAAFRAESNNSVTSLALDSVNNVLYIGGIFSAMNWGLGTQATRNRLASVDATTGVLTSWDPNSSGTVNALKVLGGNVYVGGTFSTFYGGGTTRNNLASFDLNTGNINTWNPNINSSVSTIDGVGDTLFVGGSFNQVNGTTTRNRIASYDTITGNLNSWDPNFSSTVTSLFISGDRLFAGTGSSNLSNQVTRNRLASIDTITGSLTPWNPDASSTVNTLHINGSTLYVGGAFTTFNSGSNARNRLASFDIASGNLTSWNPNASGGDVTIVKSDSTNLYVGGAFTGFNGGAVTRNRLASFNLSTGSLNSWNPNASGSVSDILISGGILYVAGSFTNFNGGADNRGYLASFSATTGSLTSWNPNASTVVSALAIDSTNLYVGGSFTTMNGGAATRNRLASFNLATGSLNSWDPNVNNGQVNKLEVSNDNIIAGGSFTSVAGDATIIRLASINKSTGVVNNWKPTPNGSVTNFIVDGNSVLTIGSSSSFNNVLQNYVAPISLSTGSLLQRD